MMDPADRRAAASERNRMALDVIRHNGGSRSHDASADVAITYPTAPMCGRCGRRNLLLDEIINQWTYCCRAQVVNG